jgi:hypothetical protein
MLRPNDWKIGKIGNLFVSDAEELDDAILSFYLSEAVDNFFIIDMECAKKNSMFIMKKKHIYEGLKNYEV